MSDAAAGTASDPALEVLRVDADSPTPPFRQLHDAAVRAISTGALRPGQRLPTIRALAAHLGLAVNTVAGAYKALEASGVLEGKGRSGTFVSLGDDPVDAAARQVAIEAAGRLSDLGVPPDRAREILTEAVANVTVGRA